MIVSSPIHSGLERPYLRSPLACENEELDDLPSEAEIAAMIRNGKTGAVIEAICRGLGLVPGVVSQQQWSNVAEAIGTFGGKFAKLVCDILFRIRGCVAAAVAANAPLGSAAIRSLEEAILVPPAPA